MTAQRDLFQTIGITNMKNQKEIEALKKQIKKKFVKYSNFTRVSGFDRYEFQRDFLCKKQVPDDLFNDIAFALEKFEFIPKRPPLDTKTRKWLKEQIDELGGVATFCQQEGFSKDTIFQYLSGYYKVITPNMQKVIDVINTRLADKSSK